MINNKQIKDLKINIEYEISGIKHSLENTKTSNENKIMINYLIKRIKKLQKLNIELDTLTKNITI